MRQLYPILLMALLSFNLFLGLARAESFTVPPGQEIVRSIGLNRGDRVSGSVSVIGGSGNDVNFYVTDPNGNTILRYDRVTQTSFSFTSSMMGTHSMRFDNSFSSFSSKSVTLDYSITPSVAGIPQEYILLLVIGGIVIVIIGVALARRRKMPGAAVRI